MVVRAQPPHSNEERQRRMRLQGDFLVLTTPVTAARSTLGQDVAHAYEPPPCVKHPFASSDRALSRRNRPWPNDEHITAALGTAKRREQPIPAVGDATDAIFGPNVELGRMAAPPPLNPTLPSVRFSWARCGGLPRRTPVSARNRSSPYKFLQCSASNRLFTSSEV
jgi:hypothetical protein